MSSLLQDVDLLAWLIVSTSRGLIQRDAATTREITRPVKGFRMRTRRWLVDAYG
ncbi:hypothetical protein X767_30940 [Mesorhizobium sp. LSJC264A00]|nr:hypothetical protein X767_30940 [Mesorhizobium sp. LSJC264A00]